MQESKSSAMGHGTSELSFPALALFAQGNCGAGSVTGMKIPEVRKSDIKCQNLKP